MMRRDPDAAPRRELTIPGTKKVVQGLASRRVQAGVAGSGRDTSKSWRSGSLLPKILISPERSSTVSGPAFSGWVWSSRWMTSTAQAVPS